MNWSSNYSGFCNPHDDAKGIANHYLCRKQNCPCYCHQGRPHVRQTFAYVRGSRIVSDG